MQWKINLTQVICLRMGKTTKAKPHRMILKSPFPRIHHYQSQAVTSIRNLTKPFGLSRNTNLPLNSYPNTQLDWYCSSNLSIQCMNLITWLSNDARIPVHDKRTNLKKIVGYKVFQFINSEDQEAPWSQNPWHKDMVASSEKMMN